MRVCTCACSVVSNSLWPCGLYSTSLLCPWNCPDKSTRVGCRFLFQGIFLTQGSNPYLLHWQADFFTTAPTGKPPNYKILQKSSHAFQVTFSMQKPGELGKYSYIRQLAIPQPAAQCLLIPGPLAGVSLCVRDSGPIQLLTSVSLDSCLPYITWQELFSQLLLSVK